MDFNLGDILTCSNKRNYTITNGNEQYPFALVDEFGEEVTKTHGYCIREAIDLGERLCVGYDYDGQLNFTYVLAVNGVSVIDKNYMEFVIETLNFFVSGIAEGEYKSLETVVQEAKRRLKEIDEYSQEID